jgi:hypothetical protein
MDNLKIPGKFWRGLIVIAGIIIGQAILYGPSLCGQKILLPLDLLAQPGAYIPSSPETSSIRPHDTTLNDLVTQFEPDRRFVNGELRAGRFPLWEPNQYGGAPFVWPKYSVFLFLESCVSSPKILPWVNLLAALVCGTGFYLFCRRALQVGFWPAAICSWCYPLTGFFILWQGFPTDMAVYWLPWVLLAVHRVIHNPGIPSLAGLSAATFFALTAGHIDVAGQVLMGSGIFAVWTLWEVNRGDWPGKKFRMAIALLVAGWSLGFLLAAPHLLPLLEYAHTGERILHRSVGMEERPPTGLVALPQIILPDNYGTSAGNSVFIFSRQGTNLTESASAGYAGVLAALLAAPLAWCGRPRARNWFWAGFAFFGMSWCLNVPGVVTFLRLPPLNMMSHNRLVFLTSFAILALAAVGLENLFNGLVLRRRWFWVPGGLLAALSGWCFYRSMRLPEPIATQLDQIVNAGGHYGWIDNLDAVQQVQAWFIEHYTVSAIFCGLGFAGWWLLWIGAGRRIFPALAVLMAADLLWFSDDRSAQCDPALYYPRVPVLNEIAQSIPGRFIGNNCLPPAFGVLAGLKDIRGYDSIDPARMVELLKTATTSGATMSYAATMFMAPKGTISPQGTMQLPPVLDMLNIRYVIFRGVPPRGITPAFQGYDYWALVNSNALPRVFIPASVESVTNAAEELDTVAATNFNPHAVAYVESPVAPLSACSGTAAITDETPTDIKISVQMDTPGMIVLADNWDKGWHAYYNGKLEPILRADYAIRGVIVSKGNGALEFVYRPESLVLGLWLASAGAAILLVLGAMWIVRRNPAAKLSHRQS